jgi:hypothetical protein
LINNNNKNRLNKKIEIKTEEKIGARRILSGALIQSSE